MGVLKKIIYTFFFLVFILVITIVTVVNSSMVIDKIARKFAPDYNLSYAHISGNVFTGIKIDTLLYNHQEIAKGIVYRWNPMMLLQKKVSINKIHIENADVSVIQSLVASLSTQKKETPTKESTEPLDFEIEVNNIAISLKPFVQEGIAIHALSLKTEKLHYSQAGDIGVEDVHLDLDTNLTKLTFDGSLHKEHFTVSNLSLSSLNIAMLQNLLASQKKTTQENNTTLTKEEEKPNAMLPKFVVLKAFHLDVLPYTYAPVELKNATLDTRDMHFNLQTLTLEDAAIELNVTTNLTHLLFNAKVKQNKLLGKVHLTPNQHLFELYKLPLRKEAIGDIVLDLNASKEQLSADIHAKARHILTHKEGEFNVDIDSLLSHIVYDIPKNQLEVTSHVVLTTPYAKNIQISNVLSMAKTMHYHGDVNLKKLEGIDANISRPLEDLHLTYKGTMHQVETHFDTQGLEGSFLSQDFKKGIFHLETKEALVLKSMVTLPKELQDTKLNAIVDAPIDFLQPTPLLAKVKVNSNLLNLLADVHYDKSIKVKATSTIPQDSLLKALDENIVWSGISPLNIEIKVDEKEANISLKAKALDANLIYGLKNRQLESKLSLGGFLLTASGDVNQTLKLKSKISSMTTLKKSIASLYALESLPPLEGSANIEASITKLKKVDLTLTAPMLTYQADIKTKHQLNDIAIQASLDASKVRLNSYSVTYNQQKIFSTKPSQVEMNGSKITISPLWINDALQVTGEYDLKQAKGTIVTEAEDFSLEHDYATIHTRFNLQTKRDAERTSVNGKITLLGGDIKYNLSQKSFASDSDILIVQEMKKREETPFMKYLSTNIQLETQKPLVLKQGPLYIKLKPSLGINKVEEGDLLVLGSVEILKGGSYVFEGKRFVLDKSLIYFTGDPSKPQLDIKVDYKSLKHLITITISGIPSTPNIHFSSKPALSREQILSVILFDSEVGGDTHSGDEMMRMMGGAMAKSALNNIGVKLDHLVLGEDNSIEVGKKLTNEITIIYVNDIVSSVKLKYEHSPRMESVFEMSEESQSYDIIFKDDF